MFKGGRMQLLEHTLIQKKHPTYQNLDKLAFLSKNLYNIANYFIINHLIAENTMQMSMTV